MPAAFLFLQLSEQGDDAVALDLRLQASAPVHHKELGVECEFCRKKKAAGM